MTKYILPVINSTELSELNHFFPSNLGIDNKSIFNIYIESLDEVEFIDNFLDHLHCYLEHCGNDVLKTTYKFIDKDLLTLHLCFMHDEISNHLLNLIGKKKDIHFLSYTNIKDKIMIEA